MAQVSLRDVVQGVAIKQLASVELDPSVSNQHELNGSFELRRLFGEESTEKRKYPGNVLFLTDDEETPFEMESIELTWYDARANHPTRTEWRLYFSSRSGFDSAKPGDTLFTILTRDQHVLLVIAEMNSTIEAQLRWLFSFTGTESVPESPSVNMEDQLRDTRIGLVEVLLLETLGIEIDDSDQNALDQMTSRFPEGLPTTRLFSAFAREYSKISLDDDSPDTVLVAWMETEERLFRAFERHLLVPLIQELGDVDTFLSLSLSVQNRRKARAGRALENHVANIFDHMGLRYKQGAITENRSRPDFLFPGQEEYHDLLFPTERLYMLGAKSTLKERWRQVLAEARRIDNKHLLTMDIAVSENQLVEMIDNHLQLVIPTPLHVGYSERHRSSIWSFRRFIETVKANQTAST